MDDGLHGDESARSGRSGESVAPSSSESPARHDLLTARLTDPDNRSPDPAVCPFFRSVSANGSLAAPIVGADDANRCAAFGEPIPQTARQQSLVCLTTGHIECPR